MNNEKTILVIEDEKGIRNFIHNALTTNGYKTILAENGKNARTAFLSQCPDLVLLDLGLPDADGLTLLQEFRQWNATPVLIVSARDKESEKVSALDMGADDYITKPFGISELMARVRIADAPLCLGNFVLPKADADERAAAVTDHHRNGQCHHRQGKYNGVGGVAVGAQIAGVCNKDLVYDVVQRTHQQRNDARDRVFLHQLADALRAEKLIGTFHGIHLYLSILGQTLQFALSMPGQHPQTAYRKYAVL